MFRYIGIILICAVCIIFGNCVTARDSPSKQVTHISIGKVVHKPGIFQANKGKYQAELTVNELGGFIVLSVM